MLIMICVVNVGRWLIYDRYLYRSGDVLMLPVNLVNSLVQQGFVSF